MPIGNVASVLRHGILSHECALRLAHRSVAIQAVQDKRHEKSYPAGSGCIATPSCTSTRATRCCRPGDTKMPVCCASVVSTAWPSSTPRGADAPAQMPLDDKGRVQDTMNPEWATLVEVLHRLESQPYAPPVGRVIFQKICYVLTELGVPTGFAFGKGSYGPFSADVKPVLHAFANRNWVHEAPLGRMVRLRVGPQFVRDRGAFAADLERRRKTIDKTVDLFSRIKNTEQAEEVLTVLYACRQIKKGDPTVEVDEQQVLDYILEWKTAWNEPAKKAAVASAIRNLAAMGWVRLRPSASFSVMD